MNLFFLLNSLFFCSNKKPIVYPPCDKCAFFKSDTSLCKKYGEKNDLTGLIQFYEALFCRSDELRCGTTGRYFIDRNETMIR